MTDTVYDADPAWSPKGDQIAFRRRDRTEPKTQTSMSSTQMGRAQRSHLPMIPMPTSRTRHGRRQATRSPTRATPRRRHGQARRSIESG